MIEEKERSDLVVVLRWEVAGAIVVAPVKVDDEQVKRERRRWTRLGSVKPELGSLTRSDQSSPI